MTLAFKNDLRIAEQAYDYFLDLAGWFYKHPHQPEDFEAFRENYYAMEQISRRLNTTVLRLRGHKNWLEGKDWESEDRKINRIYFGLQKLCLALQQFFRNALQNYERATAAISVETIEVAA